MNTNNIHIARMVIPGVSVEITVDMERIGSLLAQRAFWTATGKATACGGAVRVQANREELASMKRGHRPLASGDQP
jgi:hypothetical protein